MTDLRQAAQQALEALESGLAFAADATVLQNLRTALEQQAEPPSEWEVIKNILDEYGLDAIAFVADWKSAQRPWVGLTDDEMTEIVTDIDVDWGDLLWKVVCLTKIIEARLEERNNG